MNTDDYETMDSRPTIPLYKETDGTDMSSIKIRLETNEDIDSSIVDLQRFFQRPSQAPANQHFPMQRGDSVPSSIGTTFVGSNPNVTKNMKQRFESSNDNILETFESPGNTKQKEVFHVVLEET